MSQGDVEPELVPPTPVPTESASAAPSPPVAPTAGTSASPLKWLFVLLAVVLVSRLFVEPLVESIQHAITRGEERARAEVARTQLARLTDTSEAFRLVAQTVGPSVVHIDTFHPSFLPETKSDGEVSSPEPPRARRLRATGQGSGVILDADGYILTNHHVVENTTRIHVRLSDGRVLRDVQVIGSDPYTDLAVLRVSASGLVPAEWGDSQHLQVGDWVLAVGNPFGLDRSVTAGIISAKQRRRVVESLPFQDFLQTDAAVNPGNSGGPLVNLQGQVVGINTAIVGEAYQGISFAIPSAVAGEVYQRLKRDGRLERGWLGVQMAERDDDDLDNGTALDSANEVEKPGKASLRAPIRLGSSSAGETLDPAAPGVRVRSVFPDSPADRAGIRAGDLLVSLDGQTLADPLDCSQQVSLKSPGSTVRIEIRRAGEPELLAIELMLGARPSSLSQ